MLFLGIDAGTTSLKAGLFDEHGAARAVAAEEYSLVTPAADQAELEPEEYWRACVNAVRRVLAKANAPREEIVAVGVSSQGETTIAVDANGRALRRALVWLDNRAADQARQIAERFDLKRVYEITGDPEIIATWTACKILWLKQNEPDVFKRAHKFIFVEDFLLHRLTGRFATDGAVACTSMLWDIPRGGWWDEMLSFLGLPPERLSDPVPPGAVVGQLSRQASEELGLAPNVRVIACGMDQASGAVGAGNTQPGVISESTGAALAIQATVPASNLDPTGRLPVYVHVVRDRFLFVPVCPTGASYKRAEDGIVLVDYDKCIGCKYCAWACPYGARELDEKQKVMKKCTLCVDRIYDASLPERDRKPACVMACPTNARLFGDIHDPQSQVSKAIAERDGYALMPEWETKPANHYLPRRKTECVPPSPSSS